MKSLKTIIIAGAVLIVFIIASLVVTHLPSGSGDTTAETVSQEESSSTETAYIINRDYDSLERFTIVPTERKVDEDTSYAYASEALDVTITRSNDEKCA